jgi:hypothetical protein
VIDPIGIEVAPVSSHVDLLGRTGIALACADDHVTWSTPIAFDPASPHPSLLRSPAMSLGCRRCRSWPRWRPEAIRWSVTSDWPCRLAPAKLHAGSPPARWRPRRIVSTDKRRRQDIGERGMA